MPKRKNWTTEELGELVRLYVHEHLSLAEVCSRMHASVNIVRRGLREAGEAPRPAGPPRRPRSWTPERCRSARALYERGCSLAEIAEALETNQNRARDAILAAGGTTRRRGARTHKNVFWNGGRTTDADGYVLVRAPEHPRATRGGYVREHRLVMERTLGRALLPGEVVHHRNGKRDDNRPENLELFASNAEHLAHELAGKCPNWTPEGRARLDAVRERATRNARPKTREEVNTRAREAYAKKQAALRAARQSPT